MGRTAIVLFNLGGPDRAAAVEPFLRNLFSDPLIMRTPPPVRWLLARAIARRRGKAARANYARIGGGSPLLGETRNQAVALADALDGPEGAPEGTDECKLFVCMRYWHPLAPEVVREVKAFAPERIVLVPLYPQFSTTTTLSSLREWDAVAEREGLAVPTVRICCYPEEAGFVAALARLTLAGIAQAGVAQASGAGAPRVLFSAHGLPQSIVDAGDPYPDHVARTVAAVLTRIGGGIDHAICYQSRVGPLQWLRPYTDAEIERAGGDGVAVVVVPVAFVSEHVETLVELDMDYAELAAKAGVPAYVRVPAVGTEPEFIAGLAAMVRRALAGDETVASPGGGRVCAPSCAACPAPRE